MIVNEIFLSIQGEGRDAGFLSVFLRLTGCNLRCFYCDTTYAFYEGEVYKENELLSKINSFGVKNLCITGGEPLLQEEIFSLIKKLLKLEYKITLITNGTKDISKLPKEVIKIVDIKTPLSNLEWNEKEKIFLENHFNYKNLQYLTPNDEVKFALTCYEDFKWAMDFIEKYRIFQKVGVINLSPAYKILDAKEVIKWMKEKKSPFRLNLQIHKYIYGENLRAV